MPIDEYERRDAAVTGMVIDDHGDLLEAAEWLGPEVALPAKIPMTDGTRSWSQAALNVTCPVTGYDYTATYGNAVYQRSDRAVVVLSATQFRADYRRPGEPDTPPADDTPAALDPAAATGGEPEPFS